jgi:hypothetical protein
MTDTNTKENIMTQTTAQTFKIIGVTDDTTVCEKCGKSNLKKVVVMENILTGEIVRYGTDCAGRAMGIKKSVVDMEFDLISMIHRWMDKGLTIEAVRTALSNRGYGNQVRNGKLEVRGLSAPITL